ncbi:hypothetical protein PKO51_09370 [Yokenella regensburgei]|uniref:hypothetical protein n=1 Tax=Yokenella regensburgei TaxID=158877 RepID=UPI0027D9C1A7|nr:hypothetical protein [Yokenella regensburgei]MDQ4429568.1 hypothetical protein [Yokenella regensburgei]
MQLMKGVLAVGMVGLLVASVTGYAQDTQWQKNHPRREEVNQRLDNQDHRINHDVKDGSMSRDEAKKLHEQDKSIRHQEQADARHDNGHITKHEQKRLNNEENHVNHEISSAQ